MYWLTGVLGILMVIAPWLFGYSTNTYALWTHLVLGVVLLLLSALEAWQKKEAMWEYWVAGLVGVLAIAAPFALGFSALTFAMWTLVVLGALAVIFSGYEVYTHRQAAH